VFHVTQCPPPLLKSIEVIPYNHNYRSLVEVVPHESVITIATDLPAV